MLHAVLQQCKSRSPCRKVRALDGFVVAFVPAYLANPEVQSRRGTFLHVVEHPCGWMRRHCSVRSCDALCMFTLSQAACGQVAQVCLTQLGLLLEWFLSQKQDASSKDVFGPAKRAFSLWTSRIVLERRFLLVRILLQKKTG